MRIRGERECQDCGTRWSYYETASVECPSCGSLRSVGVEAERTLHTASPRELDLTDVRNDVDRRPLREVAETAADRCREYVRGYGWIDAGELQRLDDTYLAAQELGHVGGLLGRRLDVDEAEEFYLLSLLRGADQDERPAVDEVPDSLRAGRALAYAEAVDAYRSDLRSILEERPDPAASQVLGPVGEHVKRIRAIDGEVPPAEPEALVRAVRGVAEYLLAEDEAALAEAADRLDRLR
jgi:hypothetical protein